MKSMSLPVLLRVTRGGQVETVGAGVGRRMPGTSSPVRRLLGRRQSRKRRVGDEYCTESRVLYSQSAAQRLRGRQRASSRGRRPRGREDR